MGGAKKISPARTQKRQAGETAKKTGSKSNKEKKTNKGDSKSSKAEIRVIMTDEQAMKAIKGSKAITAQELSRQTGVKVSATNAYLIKALEKGTIKRVGGYSGHHIFQVVSA